MTKIQKLLLSFLTIIACVLLAWIFYEGVALYRDWTREPLGATLNYPTLAVAEEAIQETPSAEPKATRVFTPIVVEGTRTPVSPASLCANLPPMMILGIGSDARSDEYLYGRADVIRAIRVDFDAQTVTVLAFPRDLWVEIPEIEDDLGTAYQKLNTAYIFGNPGLGFWDHPSEGPGLLALTLERNFGLKSDHYLAVSMDVFVEAIDALGGLDFYFPDGVDGRSSYDQSARLVFPAGENHLNGEQVLTFARMRNVSTFARSSHQNVVICALEEKIKSPEIIPRIPALISAFTDNIQTDLTPQQISQLACLGTQMPRSNIIFASFPEGIFTGTAVYDPVLGDNTFIWDADFEELRTYIQDFEEGIWSQATQEDSSSPSAPTDGGASSRCE